MVRLKSQPVKSLYEIDWSHPSVVFWFFGQVPYKNGAASKLNGTSQTKDKKIEKRPKGNKVHKESNGKLFESEYIQRIKKLWTNHLRTLNSHIL